MFRLVLAEGRSLIAQRNQIEDHAVSLLKDHPDYQLLTSIPGIGPINALTILAEAGDLRRFSHHRQLLNVIIRDGTLKLKMNARRPEPVFLLLQAPKKSSP